MKPELARAVSILKREALFEGLDTSQLARIANFFDIDTKEAGVVIFSEGQPGDYFYLILEGHVRITRQERGKEHLLNVMGPGDFFGEQALLFDGTRSATAIAKDKTTLLQLDSDRFRTLLEEYPDIRQNISATAESRRLVRKIRFDWLGDDEIIYLVVKKHKLFLITRLIFPVILFLPSFLGIWIAFTAVGPYVFMHPAGLLGLFGLAIAIFLFWWGWTDWGNDYYMVTSQRVVWKEKVVVLYDSRREAPMNTIRAVNTSTTLLGRMLDYGNVDVRTFTGGILMRNLPNPELFASFVKSYQKRSRAISKEQERREIEQAIEEAIRQRMAEEMGNIPVAPAPPPIKKKEIKKKPRKSLRDSLRNYLKVRYEEKTEQGVVITYRKHWYILFKRIWLPLLLMAVPILAIFLYFNEALPGFMLVFALLFGLAISFWLWYEHEDWANDIYRLTPDQLMDIEKKPLGQEKKTTGDLDQPDFRIEHERATLLGVILDFGNVKVNVGSTEFTFDGVYQPDQVHQDIANYREAKQNKKRQEEEKRERERMIDWMVAYYQRADQIDVNEILAKTGYGQGGDSG